MSLTINKIHAMTHLVRVIIFHSVEQVDNSKCFEEDNAILSDVF